jgi:hypothetical protein
MRAQEHVVEGVERMVRRRQLPVEDVEAGGTDAAVAEGQVQRLPVDDPASRSPGARKTASRVASFIDRLPFLPETTHAGALDAASPRSRVSMRTRGHGVCGPAFVPRGGDGVGTEPGAVAGASRAASVSASMSARRRGVGRRVVG